ncbi:hypothetical protein PSHT_12605 [Puccinia striiformis]|uniref:Uncharacterized protein n=2 Tax=Puccinia striiformis TaxID=27350 RepID=A0A2S4UVL7_9BASI|nr:hypothetical protein PSHT_12605 [Puccinia striiformis]
MSANDGSHLHKTLADHASLLKNLTIHQQNHPHINFPDRGCPYNPSLINNTPPPGANTALPGSHHQSPGIGFGPSTYSVFNPQHISTIVGCGSSHLSAFVCHHQISRLSSVITKSLVTVITDQLQISTMAEEVDSSVPVPSTNLAASTTTTQGGNANQRKKRAQIALDKAKAEKNGTTSTKKAKTSDSTDNNPQFISSDYQHICSYLEDDEKFSDLYGDKKTDVGTKVLTKKAAFEIFAIYINAHSNKRLSLNGRQLQQRISYFMSKKFMPTKQFANHTGAGILDEDPHASIDELLESKCPCYARFDHIFGTRANVTPLSQFDSRRPTSLFPDGHSNGATRRDETIPEFFVSRLAAARHLFVVSRPAAARHSVPSSWSRLACLRQ